MLDNIELAELEPVPLEEEAEAEAKGVNIENAPSLLPFLFGGAVIGFLLLKI